MLALAPVAIVPGSVTGQERVPSSILGERVRVTLDGGGPRVIGAVTSIETGAIQLTDSVSGSQTFAYDGIDHLERSLGRTGNPGKGFLWGAGVGFGLGLVAGGVLVGGVCSGSASCDDQVLGVIGIAAIGALPIGLLGALIGAASSSERWEVVPIAPAQDFGFRIRLPAR